MNANWQLGRVGARPWLVRGYINRRQRGREQSLCILITAAAAVARSISGDRRRRRGPEEERRMQSSRIVVRAANWRAHKRDIASDGRIKLTGGTVALRWMSGLDGMVCISGPSASLTSAAPICHGAVLKSVNLHFTGQQRAASEQSRTPIPQAQRVQSRKTAATRGAWGLFMRARSFENKTTRLTGVQSVERPQGRLCL